MNIEIVPGGSAVAVLEELFDQENDQWINDATIDDANIYHDGTGALLVGPLTLTWDGVNNGRYKAAIPYTVTAPLVVGTPTRGKCTPRRPDGRRMPFFSRGRVIESGTPTP